MAQNHKRAGEEADRLIAEQARLKAEAEGQVETPPQQEQQDPPSETADVIPDAVVEDAVIQHDVSVQNTTAPIVSDPQLELLRKEVETANQRWKVLQGMIDKKESENENMRALLAQMSQKAEKPADVPTRMVTQDDEEVFGAEHIDLARRIAGEVFEQKITALNDKITRLENSITGVGEIVAKTAAETFDEALERRVPDWRITNVDPAFMAWLSEEEGMSGRTRLDLLNAAYSSSDLVRTAKFFTAFRELNAKPGTPAPKVDNVTKLISPGKSRSAATPAPAPANADIWTKADIARLYDDKRNGRITQAQFDDYERDLFAAQHEGRLAA